MASTAYIFYHHPQHGLLREWPGSWHFDAWSDPVGGGDGRWHQLRSGLAWAFMSQITEERARGLIGDGDLFGPNGDEGDTGQDRGCPRTEKAVFSPTPETRRTRTTVANAEGVG
jgi:hypothetical protein